MEESGGFSERKGGFSACGKLGESGNVPAQGQRFNYYSYAAGDCLLTHDDTD
jgi:hypothetical protein